MNDNLYIDGQLDIYGTRGYSAYEVAVRNGFVGTEEEWLASLVGPQGPQGEQGEQGVQGEPGPYPNLRMGSVETLAPTEQAYANFTGTPQNPILHMGIPQGIQGIQGIQGPQGEQGIQGKPFTVVKTYSSVSAMQNDFNNMNVGDYVMIATSVEIEDNAKLYYRSETQWVFISDFSGAQGIQGEQGPTGPQGVTGNGIASVTKTSSDPVTLIDTYTILFTNGTTTTFTVQNGFDGEVQQEDLDEVIEVNNKQQNEIDLLNMLYDMFPKTTGEGTNITLNNTKKARLGVDLSGDLSQETTTGKNLINNFRTTTIINGVTFTVNEDGTILINGTATADTTFIVSEQRQTEIRNTLLNKSLILNGCPSGGSNSTYRLQMFGTGTGTYYDIGSGTNNFTFTNESSDWNVAIIIREGTTCTNLLFKPMVRLSTITDDSYEPYTNGASPNPDYPQEIKVVTGNQNVKVNNKNFIDYENLQPLYISASTYSIINDGIRVSETSAGTYRLITFNLGKTEDLLGKIIRFKCDFVASGQNIGAYGLGYCDANGDNRLRKAYTSTSGTTIQMTIDNTNTNIYLLLYANVEAITSTAEYVDFTNIIGTVDNEDMSYQVYQSQTYPLSLGSLELAKIGNYKDYIYKENGKWYKYGAINKRVINGSESFRIGTTKEITQVFQMLTAIPFRKFNNYTFFSNYFINQEGDTEKLTLSRNEVYFAINKTTASTVADFKIWLSTHNTTIYYILETPTITEITDTNLIEQLDNLYNANSYDDTTIIFIDGDLPVVMSATSLVSLDSVYQRREEENNG